MAVDTMPLASAGLAARRLRWRDWFFCRRVASDPVVRAQSWDHQLPTTRGHFAWMWRQRRDPACAAFILVDDSLYPRRVGVLTWNIENLLPPGFTSTVAPIAWLGIAIAPPYRGLGIGFRALRAAVLALHEDYPGVDIRACIRRDNMASRAAFRRAGFKIAAFDCRHVEHPQALEVEWPS